jgi:hypothetical protein
VYPNLIAAVVEDRRRSCRCGLATSQLHEPCRRCYARISWRRRTNQRSQSVGKNEAKRRARAWTWVLAMAASVLRVLAKGARS